MSTTSTFSGALSLGLILNELLSGEENGSLSLVPDTLKSFRMAYANGTSYAAKGYRDKQDGIAASQTVTYDLIGSLTDVSGATINFDVVDLIIFLNRSASGGDLLVGPAGSNSWVGMLADASDRLKVPAGRFHIWGGSPGIVSAGSDSFSVITPGSGSAYAWDMIIVGRDNT